MPDFKQISQHVWIYPPDKNTFRPVIGAIITPTQTVLIDTGNCHNHAREVIAALGRINAPPISHLIYTHHHWDHIFGGQIYDVPIVAHMVCEFRVIEYAKNPWSHEHVERVIREIPALTPSFSALRDLMRDDWGNFHIVLPSIIIRKKADFFPLDGVNLLIEHIGGNHADDSTLVTVVEDNVMFMADCFYPPPAHIAKPDDKPNVAMVRKLLERQHAIYVDGHGGAFSASFWRTWADMQG